MKNYSKTKTRRRFNAFLSIKVFKHLKELAASGNTSMTDVLEKAIRLKHFVDTVYKQQGELLIKRNGEVKELIKELYSKDLV